MPRIDRTFSDTDVLRIIEDHLTPEERQNVLDSLMFGVRRSLLEGLIEELTAFIPIVSTILDVAGVLGVLFDQADVRRAKEASLFVTERRNALRRALDAPIDF